MIPKNLYICDKTLGGIKKKSLKWKKLNPEYHIELYDNDRCLESLDRKEDKDIFNFISDGPIKADFWRLCILYKNGGVYVDADNDPVIPISDFLELSADIVTCNSFWHTKGMNFNPAFIMCKKENKFIKKCIDIYISWYREKKPYSYWGWSIMEVFNILKLKDYNNSDGIYVDLEFGYKVQIINEIETADDLYGEYNTYKGKNVFYNRSDDWDNINHCFIK